ncbi:hypothetical protein [Streptomyces sp. NRRL B-1347]|uniref:hypothetical protein n=1 Tax=Streptomyces sp. NRRL B-1347 TaxID=1476877 RepID=UPI000B1BBA37|nr:hypothetical protein [Streptomyces sp. NRRL B-1347]
MASRHIFAERLRRTHSSYVFAYVFLVRLPRTSSSPNAFADASVPDSAAVRPSGSWTVLFCAGDTP